METTLGSYIGALPPSTNHQDLLPISLSSQSHTIAQNYICPNLSSPLSAVLYGRRENEIPDSAHRRSSHTIPSHPLFPQVRCCPVFLASPLTPHQTCHQIPPPTPVQLARSSSLATYPMVPSFPSIVRVPPWFNKAHADSYQALPKSKSPRSLAALVEFSASVLSTIAKPVVPKASASPNIATRRPLHLPSETSIITR